MLEGLGSLKCSKCLVLHLSFTHYPADTHRWCRAEAGLQDGGVRAWPSECFHLPGADVQAAMEDPAITEMYRLGVGVLRGAWGSRSGRMGV